MSVVAVLLASALRLVPNYADITVPPNIAPLNFNVEGVTEPCRVELAAGDDILSAAGPNVRFPQGAWRDFLSRHAGGRYEIRLRTDAGVTVCGTNAVSRHPIDSHLTYRLIAPAYVDYDEIGTWQRDLRNFSKRRIYRNKQIRKQQCVNCHTYCRGESDTYVFHVRANDVGTEIVSPKYGRLRCDLKVAGLGSSGSYPAWHPSGDYLALSVNETQQMFYTVLPNKLEVMDLRGDLILYSLKRNEVSVVEDAPENFETYPTWSADGRFLYTSCAHTDLKHLPLDDKYRRTMQVATRVDQIRYDLVERRFDPETGKFGAPRIIVDARQDGVSVTHPRTTPDGRWLVAVVSAWGVFPIGHRESDLWLFELATGQARRVDEVNSWEAESFPSFGKSPYWMAFSSRRGDGLFTRFYIAAFDPDSGRFGKPFLLPQEDPAEDGRVHASYNIPEFSNGPVRESSHELRKLVEGPVTTPRLVR